MASAAAAAAAAANQAPSVQEYSIRVPKNTKKSYKVMRFNSSVNVDFTKWGQVKMERENNMKEFKGTEEEMPKFGAGSEFGREAREEARRKKFGIVSKKYRPEDQPWLLKVGGKTGKKFKGTREGGVAENAAYYVFTHAPDGAIEAFPLQEWYNFQPTQRYKALSAEEAEQEFGRRNKQVNYFSLMMRKRLRGENEDDPEEGDENKTKSKKGKGKKGELKISEMDDWVESSDSSDSEEENKEQEEEKKDAKKKKNVANAKKKKKKDPDDEAFEESDDGDEEGREVDYISDSSESASDHETKANKELKGVEEEDGLRKLLSSGEEDEEEEEKQEGEKEEEPDDKQKEAAGESKGEKEKKSKKKSQKKKKRKDDDTNGLSQISKDSSSDLSSDSSDSEGEAKKKPGKPSKEPNSGASSRSATPTKEPGTGDESRKRKADQGGELSMSKKSRLDNFASATLSPVGSLNTGESGITEDAVRRYLMRKPMTTTELLQKFKSKKTGLTSEQLVHIMTQILKRINPVKQTIKGKMYLSIKG